MSRQKSCLYMLYQETISTLPGGVTVEGYCKDAMHGVAAQEMTGHASEARYVLSIIS